MKLQTQLTIPKKDLRDLDYVRKMQTFKTLKQISTAYLSKDDYLVYFY